jgi:hypothetical protein
MSELKYIQFVDAGYSSSGKTRVWEVATRDDAKDVIGEVRWFASWRCYAFYPYDKTVFEKTCLRDIANFCEDSTSFHNWHKKEAQKE